MSVVGDGDAVGVAVVFYTMNARHLALAATCNQKWMIAYRIEVVYSPIGIVKFSHRPVAVAVVALNDLLGKCDGCARRMVELMHVVHLLHADVVLRKFVHYLCQIAVHCREDSHSDREIGSPEERLPFFLTHAAHILLVVCLPSRRPAHNLHSAAPCLQVVVVGSSGIGELYRYIGRRKRLGVEVLLVVDVDFTNNLVASGKGYLLYHAPHLAVANKCYFHKKEYFKVQK